MIRTPVAVASRTFSKHPVLRAEMAEVFSRVKFNDQGTALKDEALVDFLRGSVGAIVALEKIGESVLKKLPELKVISKYGVGLDNLDLNSMEKRRVELGWTGGVNARSVAELALSFMLGITRNVFWTSYEMKKRIWQNLGGEQISGKTVGVIGCGHIGKDLSKILKVFGCKILLNDIVDVPNDFLREVGAKQVSLKNLLENSDIVSLHVPYDESTHHMIGKDQLDRMKSTAILINTSRGNTVDESALYKSLKEQRIRGAGMDVFAVEPPLESPLLDLMNFWGTPHIGGSSQEAILAMGRSAIQNLKSRLE